MTTISPNRKRAALRLRLFSFLVLAAAVIFVVALLREPAASLLWSAGGPAAALRSAWASGFSAAFSSFNTNHALVLENNRLARELASSSLLLLDRQLLYKENLELKSRMGRAPPQTITILANVLSRPPQTPYDTLMIDAGREDGVVAGDFVSAGGSVYIGEVREVYARTARVVLFSAPGETHSALVLPGSSATSSTASSLAISVAGHGGGSLTAQVPAGAGVRAGDRVVFSSIMPEFVATVVSVEKKDQTSFNTIYMHLPVSISALRHVEVRRIMPARYDAQ